MALKLPFLLFFTGLLSGAAAQQRAITGKIISQDKPLESATVVIAGTRLGTTTSIDGTYRISPIPGDTCELVVSLIGYKTRRLKVVLREEITIVNVVVERDASELNQVVVTGVSKATLLRENPLPVEVVSTRQIEQTTETNVIDVLSKNAQGLDAVQTGPNVSKPFINGLGYNRVLTLFDGMRVETQQWGDEHGVPVDDYSVDKAEVIKGPASLLYGSDAVAGVVSLFPPVPGDQDGRLKVKYLSEYQSNNGLIGNALRLSYSGSHWLWAFRGSERIARNYNNPIDGRVYNTSFRTMNASALVGYRSAKGYTHLNLTLYDNLQGIPDGSRDSLTRKFTYQVYETEGENTLQPAHDDIKNRPVVPGRVLDSYDLSPLHQRIQDYRLYVDNAYRIGAGDLKVLLGIEQNARREYDHPTDPQQAGLYVRLTTLNYGVRYNAPSFLGIETSFGANGMVQHNKNLAATDFPIPNYRLFDFGTYGYAKWKEGRWSIAGGIRYDHRTENGEEMYTKPNPSTGFYMQVPLSDSAGGIHQFPAFALAFKGLSGSIGLTYQFSDHLSFKANIGRGYRAPNITEIASNGLDPGAHIVYEGNLHFQPEFSLQEDIGIEGAFNNLLAGLSVFNNYLQHFIYEAQAVDQAGNPIVIVPGNKTFQYQQTNAQLYGMEARIDIHPGNWKGFDFNNRFSTVYGFNRNPLYSHQGVGGAYLPFIPPARLLSVISQDIATRRKAIPLVTVKAEVDYNSDQNRYLGLYNTETPTPAYTLVNASVHTTFHLREKQTLQAQIQVNNVFNTAYQSHLSRLQYFEYYAQSPNGHLGIYNMGRNICLRIIMDIL